MKKIIKIYIVLMVLYSSGIYAQNYIKVDTSGRVDKIITNEGRLELINHYHSNGQIKRQFTFLYKGDSLIGSHGSSIHYYKSGQVQYAEMYFEGFRVGDFLEYYKSGKLKSESFFLPDSSADLKVYSINGKIDSPFNTASLGISGTYESKLKYLPHGIWKEYYENGQVKSVKHFNKGLETGKWLWFYDDGKKKMEGEFIEEDIHIPLNMNIAVSCDDCDYIMSNIFYTFLRKKKGEWSCWDKNGLPVKCIDLYK